MKTALKLILAIASFSFATASLAQAQLSDSAKSALDTAAAGVVSSPIDTPSNTAFLNTVTALIKANPANASDIVAYAVTVSKKGAEFDDAWLEAIADAANRGAPELDIVIRKKITQVAGQPLDVEILINGKPVQAVFGLQNAANASGKVTPSTPTSPPTSNPNSNPNSTLDQ